MVHYNTYFGQVTLISDKYFSVFVQTVKDRLTHTNRRRYSVLGTIACLAQRSQRAEMCKINVETVASLEGAGRGRVVPGDTIQGVTP